MFYDPAFWQHGLIQLAPHFFLLSFEQHCFLQSEPQLLFTFLEQSDLLQSLLHEPVLLLQLPDSEYSVLN